MGFKGRDEIQKLIRPLMAHQTPDVEDYENLRALDDELSLLAEKIGFGSAGSLAFLGLAGAPIVYDAAKKSITTTLDNAAIKANDIADTEAFYAKQGFRAKTSGSKVPLEAAKNAGKANKGTKGVIKISKVLKDIGNHIWGKAAGQAAKSGASAGAGTTGAAAAGKLGFQIGSTVGFRLVLSVAVVGALATVGDIAASIAETIKAEKYEDALHRSANTVNPFAVSKTLGRNPDGLAKANLFMQLLKMTIADPADQGLLTIDYPTTKCPPGMKNGTKTICVWEVKFHNQASLTMEQTQQIANANGWEIATAEEVEKAWYYLEYEKYAFGRTADGNFAVPVVKDYSNFKSGPNLNAVGGNQGFFHTVGKAKRSIRKENLPKIR
ncbi:MAG: hypothetical protein KDB79_16420 [Acidobacteria bacterium]|nr:hypothetical protein [Acidobacteriota bacterium]